MTTENETLEDMAPLSAMTAAVAFRGPVFCNKDPAMWFAILECNFKAANITKSLTKFNHAVALIPPESLSLVSDVVSTALNSDTPYDDLKTATLARLQSSAATRLKELLSKEELGNEKPSGLLRRMKKLLADKYATFDQEVFKQLYYQRLPSSIQGHLFTVKDKLGIDELSQLADEFMATVQQPPTVNTVQTPSSLDPLTDAVAKLTLQINTLQKQMVELQQRSRSRSTSLTRRRPRQRSPSTSRDPSHCYYHQRFGARALRCHQPCSYAAAPTTSAPAATNTPSLNPTGGR